MGCWTHNMWLLFIVGLQVGLLTALAPDSKCDPNTEFSCRNDSSICIALSRVRDGKADCPDRSDEECNEAEFQCQSIHQCIPRERLHDGWPDCDDGSDEECGRGQFRCRCGIPHCIEGSKVKDGTKHCEDGSDEEKSKNKTVRCPDESRLQDLLAVEKRRRKRQIHAFGARFEADGGKIFDGKPSDLQPSMSGSYSNNFQYSYTKFLNERLSREEYNPLKEVKLSDETETQTLNDGEKTLSTKPYVVRTETDLYGSLKSGNIYQTAVNEPISVLPSAEYTIMKFDNVDANKKAVKKANKNKFKSFDEHQPRRFSNLMLKIAALFRNDSEVDPAVEREANKKADLKSKASKNNMHRKLLSVANEEAVEQSDMRIFKRSLQNSDTEVSHIPLVHSPTVPYMPQSNIHTTGIVMSTTGIDIINGRTTEWTTIVEGTFISGTYAHIVHSTSRIYYTVDIPETTTEKIPFGNEATRTSQATLKLKIDSTKTKKHFDESTENIKTTTTKEYTSRSQRINDKSLRALDAFIESLSNSRVANDFPIAPTGVFTSELDVTTIKDDVESDSAKSEDNSYKSVLINPLEVKGNGFNILSTTVEEAIVLEKFKSTDSFSVDSSKVIEPSTLVFLPKEGESENFKIDVNKNVDFDDENPLISESELEDMNLVGRMIGDQDPEQLTRFNISSVSTVSKNTSDVLEVKEILPISTFIESDIISNSTTYEEFELDSKTENRERNEFNMKSSIVELLSSSVINIDTLESGSDISVLKSENEQISPMETSLRMPEVSDLFAIFPHEPIKRSKLETNLNGGEDISATVQSDNIGLISSSIVSTILISTMDDSSLTSSINQLEKTTEMHDTESSISDLKNSTSFLENTVEESSIQMDLNSNSSSTERSLLNIPDKSMVESNQSLSIPGEETVIGRSELDHGVNNYKDSSMNSSDVMVFLGIASTLEFTHETSSSPPLLSPTTNLDEMMHKEQEDFIISESVISKSVDTILLLKTSVPDDQVANTDSFSDNETPKRYLNDMSDITVLLLPSMNLEELKNFMVPSFTSSIHPSEREYSEKDITLETINTISTPALDDSILTRTTGLDVSESNDSDKTLTTSSESTNSEEFIGRAKRAISESVTILRPGGRIVSTDAYAFLTPTTHYTTYTYFTTVLIPGGGSRIQSSLHVDSVILEPTDRAVYAYEDNVQPCEECRLRNTAVYDDYETRHLGRPITEDHYHVETVPYDISRASEITHRTTYTYYTTRFRAGTPFVETRKETKTGVTPLPTGRYSPFEIGTYYDGDYPDSLHYHTDAPRIAVSRPHDITHRTTYTYYTTRIRNGVPIVETRRETTTDVTPIPTYRPGHQHTHAVSTSIPTYAIPIDPNLYKPDRVTHRTTYTYHTTRFRDGVPIVNTREETETNVTPIPTYTRPTYTNRQTAHRIVPSRPATYNAGVLQTYNPYNRQGSNPHATHRTTYTYFTTRLVGGRTHVDTRYVTETNITPNPNIPYVRGTTYAQPHNDYDNFESECPVCLEAQRHTVTRHENRERVRGRTSFRPNSRTERVDTEITPSTATLYSTYTYATTQLTRDGRPVVRTREHTVTEVLSDVVLPTLKFGDRIRSKRTVRPEEEIPRHTIDRIHVVPIRHTFSRTNSYADGRQGRRIPINDRNQNRVNTVSSNHGRIPYSNKDKNEHERFHNSNNQNNFEIRPTNVTFYSTYTYFTTELEDGKPVTKSREHTVTEILTDVIVPTVSAVRHPSGLRATRAYNAPLHRREARRAEFSENTIPFRRLLSVSYDTENIMTGSTQHLVLAPSVLNSLSKDNSFQAQILNTVEPRALFSSQYNTQSYQILSHEDMEKSSETVTPPLEMLHSIDFESNQDVSSDVNNAFKIISSEEDLIPAGAEVRKEIAASPITHYTTYTYYTTKIKPGGSRIIETNTKVSSSVIYPQTIQTYDGEVYPRNSNKRKLYADRHPSPVSHITKTKSPEDILRGYESQEIRRSSNSYGNQRVRINHRTCTNCHNRGGNQRQHELPASYNRISRVQNNDYLTRIPVTNADSKIGIYDRPSNERRIYDRSSNARRIPDRTYHARRIADRVSNSISYADPNIKPTRVTYYSTYTYFTTEPVDGSSVVRSREHTVTEVLTDVIVPTVASFKRVQATPYAQNLHHRSRRHDSAISAKTFKFVNRSISRKLLSLDDTKDFTTDTFLSTNISENNSKTIENVLNTTENNLNITSKNTTSGETFLFTGDRQNLTLTEKDPMVREKGNETTLFRRSEIFNNDTSQLFEISNEQINENASTFKEFVFEATDTANKSELSNVTSRTIIEKTDGNSSKYSDVLPRNVSLTLKENNITDVELTTKINEEYLVESIVRDFGEDSENEDGPRILSSSPLNFYAGIISSPELAAEDRTSRNGPLNSNLESDISKSAYETIRNGFIYRTSTLEVTQPSLTPSTIDASFSILETPTIEKLELSNFNKFIYSPSNTDKVELFSDEDLDAAGADVRHAIVATPTTHYTTYTYYSTVLKPGGRREVITNTKVSTSTYYPSDINHNGYTDYYRNKQSLNNNRISKTARHDISPQATKAYYIYPEREVVRHQFAYPPSREFRSYKPSFATKVRISQHHTVPAYSNSHNRCLSCSKQYDYDRNSYNRNGNNKEYLTRLPARRTSTHPRRISNSNTIPYEAPDVKPTRVTYYSTYTYFTTELQEGSPVVKSREHTVTEILTDVIVPTVTSVSPTLQTKFHSSRGKRYVPADKKLDTSLFENLPLQRKLLNVENSNENTESDDKLEENVDALISSELNSHFLNSVLEEDISDENILVASFEPQQISPTLQPYASTAVEINDNFLGNAQISKAFEAYLAFLDSAGVNTENVTLNKEENVNFVKESEDSNLINPTKQLPESVSNYSTDSLKSNTKSMTSVLTSEAKKNGRITKYTTTIYGTYINGVYAQRAKSRSDIIPITEMDIPDMTVMFSPSRLPGLVRSIVSRKIRGPVAVHLTTEIHGTFVGGAYAQTARVFTSSQPLSPTRESSRHRIQSYSTTIPQGTRKTGLLSTRILRSKVDGSTTLLFVSEIYGTHIGGAYAHLGTYTTRTHIQSTSTTEEPEPTSTSLPTYYMEDLTTGLVTASISEKSLNGKTTRYHYQVYGTYLDGTYAHVPSISTETLFTENDQTVSDIKFISSLKPESTNDAKSDTSLMISLVSKSLEITSSKIGLIHASTRAHVTNGTTTQHIFEVHGTYLNGNYAHVPSVSVITIMPSKTSDVNENFHVPTLTKSSDLETDFEVLTIFSDLSSINEGTVHSNEDTTLFLEHKMPGKDNTDINEYENSRALGSSAVVTRSFTESSSIPTTFDFLENSDRNDQTTNFFPVLLPEALRLSFSRDNFNHRIKRNDPFSPYLRSSFTDSIKSQQETHRVSLTITTPLPTSIFNELSMDSIKNSTKVYPKTESLKCLLSKTKYNFNTNIREKSAATKGILSFKTKLFLKRSKRSPTGVRSTFGSSKRFGGSSTSSVRAFSSSSGFKRNSGSKSTTGYRSTSRGLSNPTKSISRSLISSTSKSIPNFLSRSQRTKPVLSAKTTTIKSTSSTNINVLPSIRSRRFGKKEPDQINKMEEDFEASEAIVQSITEEKIKPSSTSTNRFRRPTKLPKLNARSQTIPATSRSNKIISPSRRSRLPIKNIHSASRSHKNNFRDYDYDIKSSFSEPVENTSTKRKFTLTTTFEINLKSTASFFTSVDDTDEGNNLQAEDSAKSKRRNKSRASSGSYRNREGNSYKPIFDNDDNEVKPDKPKSLPLPVFGRSRGLKSRPKFDPRTIKATSTAPTSTIIYLSSMLNETDDTTTENLLNGPITVTDVFTTIKTLPVHLGPRTSFATITTTAFTTSTIHSSDLTLLTLGGITKTILSAITGFPDANLPADKQFTVITEIILTTTEIESTSLVAIKVGYGTRTDTIVEKQILTTLATQTNTIMEEKTTSIPFQQQYPYFPNPFAPQLPAQNSGFSLSLSENSFVSTQTITSTTVLSLFFNGKTVLTTLTSTSLSEETLVKTTTFKVPQQPTVPPFVFPQPVFILPSITTQLTVKFTANNGEVYSIVTLLTVPLSLNGHTRFARSVTESYINPTTSNTIVHKSTDDVTIETELRESAIDNYSDSITGTYLQSSFSTNIKESLSNHATESLALTKSIQQSFKSINNLNSAGKSTDEPKFQMSKAKSLNEVSKEDLDLNNIEFDTYKVRKLLQFDSEEEDESLNGKGNNDNARTDQAFGVSNMRGSTALDVDDYTYVPDTYHLIGPGFNEDGLSRPIPTVRVVPTRRAYVRRLKPSGSQNLPFEANGDEFNFRQNFNNQNFPINTNIQPGSEFSPIRPGLFQDENIGSRRNIPSFSNRPLITQDGPVNNFGTLRNVQYFSPNRPNIPSEFDRDGFSPARIPQNYPPNRPNRIQDIQPNLGSGRNPPNYIPTRNNRPPQVDGYDAIRNLPSYTPTRQNSPSVPLREEPTSNSNQFGDETARDTVSRPQSAVTPAPRRVIRLRRPVNSQQARPESGRELLDRKPIVNSLPDEKESNIRARGPVVLTNTATIQDINNPVEENRDTTEYTDSLPLTYYTTFTYMTTFLNGPSTAYSTREAVVSNIATETLNPKLVGIIRTRGGFSTPNGIQTAVPLGSRAQGATTTIVNLASRVQLYNSDVYYGRHVKPSGMPINEDLLKPTAASLRTLPITDIASLPKTYYTLFTYFYTLRDGDKSTHSQRSETISNVDSQTEPFVLQDFASTIDSSGLLTLKPNKHIVNLGLRTAGGTTTEVNLELKTIVHFDGLKNVAIDRGSMTPTLVEMIPSETNSILNNYLDPDDAEVQDQQTYPQTVPIQPSFSSANEVYPGTQRSSSNREATPEIPSNNRISRTQSVRGPLRVASTILQRPGTLRSGVFAPRPGVRVRVRPVSSRVLPSEEVDLSSLQPDVNSVRNFDSSRSISDDVNDFDEEDADVTEEDDHDEYTTEDMRSTEEDEISKESSSGRKRLKITIRRSPGVQSSRTNSGIIRPTRTRPRFYVVTRTASPTGGTGRQPKRPVSVKVSRRPRPSEDAEYETYTTMTSVPVVFGLSTTYRNALVTSSSLVTPDVNIPDPSKTVVLTYFTTTTYTVPYTVDGIATYTTLEETNSRIATETLDPNSDLSFVSTTTLDYGDEILVSSADIVRQPPQTLKPQLVNNQLNVGPRINLATKISNGVTLIVATDGEIEATHVVTQPTLTLRPTMVTDALLMTNKDITTVYEPRTFYTTFTFFTTFFSGSTPSISTSEQVITNVYSVPVTHSITRTQPAGEPFTIIETSENLVSRTLYSTHTFYATIFNGTGTIVTPIEELQSSVVSSTETYTITKTIMPTLNDFVSQILPTEVQPVSTTTTSIYRTRTNFVTLFRGSESIVSPLEEIETDIVTLTLDNREEQPTLRPKEFYTTRTIQATNTHYITLFSGSESILSSITEVAPSVITELVKQLQESTITPFLEPISIKATSTISRSSASVEPTFQDLVPSIRTQYTTLTYFTTLFTDSSTILSSREEVATSYITLFVPAPLPGATSTEITDTHASKTNLLANIMSSKSDDRKRPSIKPTSEILTFYTTYTYYTTLFRGTETIISDSETVVTQYVTIESTPTDTVSRHTTSLPPTFLRPNYSDSFEVRIEPSATIAAPPTLETIKSDSSSKVSSEDESDEDIQIIGVSTKVESGSDTPSILTGIPTTDSNGATHILFTDFIVPSSIEDSPLLSTDLFSEYMTPSLPDLISSVIFSEPSSVSFDETTIFSNELSTPSSARDSASDLATTRLTDANVATHHMVLHSTTSYNSGSSQTLGIKPGAVIDLSDVLTNTNLVGNLGETIKDIVNLFAANGNRAKNISSKASPSSMDSSVLPPSGGITVSSAEDPVYIPIGAIARSTKTSTEESSTGGPIIRPSTMLSGFTPIMTNDNDINNRKVDSATPGDIISGTLTSIVFGSNTIFIQPTNVVSDIPATMLFSDMDGRFHSFFDTKIQGSVSNQEGNQQQATPGIKYAESTSIVSGLETIFFGFPDVRQPPQSTTKLIQGSSSTSSIVGYETIFFDSPGNFYRPGSNQVNITGDTTIFGTFPAFTESSSSSSTTPESTFTSTSSGETTIFFPVPGDNHQQNPGTRYVTSVESVTLTLTLTTSSVYQTEDTPVTVTSVFTTTIPPRTFVSTIIGDRTILGTQPEPTEAVQVIPTMQPSESTTTVTTTTLIFNSIATTVVRTLVIPTNAIQPTKPSTTEATERVNLGGIVVPSNERPKVTTERTTTPRKPIQLFKSGFRPTEPTTPKPQRAGPVLKLFPTKPPTTTTLKPPSRPTTTRKNTFRKPGKTLVPITDGCLRECNLKNKEVCKQNPDKTWSCQCRPGFFKKNGSEECRDVKSYTVLVRVLKMGDNEVTYSPGLSNHLSPEYKNLTTTARKAVDDAYKTSSVGDDFVSTNILGISRDSGIRREGVLVNLTVQLSGEKPASEEFLKDELAQSLEAAASEIFLANATIVSPIYQRVEDVQDFDECYDDSYNDCSRSAVCVNLPGTYTCECRDGYQDLEPLLPGRICSGEIKDCDYCNNRGVCIMTEDDNKFCRCYRMYLGKQCEINGLVLAIALPIALALLILTMFCLLCGCRKLRQRRAQKPKPNVFKGMVPPLAGTLDRKAMIMDSSSESSGEHRPPAHAYDGFGDEVANSTMKRSRRSEPMDDHISEFQVPTVLIPRAKHSHPKQVNAPYPNYRMPHGDMDRW